MNFFKASSQKRESFPYLFIYLFIWRAQCVCARVEFFSCVYKPEKLPVALFASRLCSKSVLGLPELSINLQCGVSIAMCVCMCLEDRVKGDGDNLHMNNGSNALVKRTYILFRIYIKINFNSIVSMVDRNHPNVFFSF